uniref:ZP-N domain-containing protein n=1 Tax=Pygocentrus nattereri TaxID=42514 RepID=A0AAR2JYY3_PYGNA
MRIRDENVFLHNKNSVPCVFQVIRVLKLLLFTVDFETECRDRYFFVSVQMPSPGSQLQFQAFGAGEAYPITAQHGEFCGCTVQTVLYCVVLGASYFACHKEIGFKCKLVMVNLKGGETSAIISKTCSLTFYHGLEEWSCIMFEKEGQHSEVMSAEKTAAVDYFLMSAIGRIVFRTAFGRPYATIKMVGLFQLKVSQFRETYLPSVQIANLPPVFFPFIPPAFSSQCEVNGISFKLDHKTFKYMREFIIGPYPLTQQLAHNQGYIMINDGQSLVRHAPLFITGYFITLQQFSGTFEILTRNAKTLEFAQSSARRCRFKTTELLVCSTHGVMTVLSDVTEAVLRADPARATLLDRNCKPRDFDETKVLFSFGLNTCGTRVKINKQFISYENEILFSMLYSSEIKPVITSVNQCPLGSDHKTPFLTNAHVGSDCVMLAVTVLEENSGVSSLILNARWIYELHVVLLNLTKDFVVSSELSF